MCVFILNASLYDLSQMSAILPTTLNNCVLSLGDGGHMKFLQPSATVEVNGVVVSYRYEPSAGTIDLVPIGGKLGDFCTVEHTLSPTGPAWIDDSVINYPVRDIGKMIPCSSANRAVIPPSKAATTAAILRCPAVPRRPGVIATARDWDAI